MNNIKISNIEPQNIDLINNETQNINIANSKNITTIAGSSNYEELENKPSINGVELIGNKTTEDLGIVDIELIPEIKSESIEEDLKPNQVYNGNAIHDLARLFGMTLAELVETLPVIVPNFDIEYTYEDNEVYNANAIHQLLELFVYEITMIQEEVASYSERISALEEKLGG